VLVEYKYFAGKESVHPYSQAVNSHVSKPNTASPASLSILLSGEQADDHMSSTL